MVYHESSGGCVCVCKLLGVMGVTVVPHYRLCEIVGRVYSCGLMTDLSH